MPTSSSSSDQSSASTPTAIFHVGRAGIKKRWAPKVRSGCITCRERRVKCDEAKPQCLRCRRLEEPCRYEHKVNLASFRSDRSIVRSTNPADQKQALKWSRTPVFGSPEETRYLDTFLTVTAPWIGHHNTSARKLFNGIIPQASWNHPALRHAVVAVGMASEQYYCPISTVKPHRRVWHYNQALQHLYSDGAVHGDVVLLCCTLFWTHDIVMNNARAAMIHLQGFMRLGIERKQKKMKYLENSNLEDMVMRSIVGIGHYQDPRIQAVVDTEIVAKIHERVRSPDYSQLTHYEPAVLDEANLFYVSTAWARERNKHSTDDSYSLYFDELQRFAYLWHQEFSRRPEAANHNYAMIVDCNYWLWGITIRTLKNKERSARIYDDTELAKLETYIQWVESLGPGVKAQVAGEKDQFPLSLIQLINELLRLAPTNEMKTRVFLTLKRLKRVEALWNADVVASLFETYAAMGNTMNLEGIAEAAEIIEEKRPGRGPGVWAK